MKRPLVLFVALVAGLACTSSPALAQGSHGGAPGGPHVAAPGRPVVSPPIAPPRGFGPRRSFRRPLVPNGVIVAPGVVYGGLYDSLSLAAPPDPVGFYAAPESYDSQAGYSGSMVSMTAPPPPPPPMPSVVEYANGRSELRGDGVTTPYRWVWIPNPPPPPPTGPPSAPDDSPMYRYKDDQGELHLTNRWSSIPKQYQSRTERINF